MRQREKDKYLTIRVSSKELEELKEYAKKKDVPVSILVRLAIKREYLRNILGKEED